MNFNGLTISIIGSLFFSYYSFNSKAMTNREQTTNYSKKRVKDSSTDYSEERLEDTESLLEQKIDPILNANDAVSLQKN